MELNDLKEKQCWLVWKYEQKEGADKPTKVPYQAKKPAKMARVNDPKTTAATYNDAENSKTKNGFDGVGFVLHDMAVIDIDQTKDGQENPLMSEIMALFAGAYIEKSPSGKGVHILFSLDCEQVPQTTGRGKAPTLDKGYYQKNPKNGVECYVAGLTRRYMTFTGAQVSNGQDIPDMTGAFLAFLEKYMRRDNNEADSTASAPAEPVTLDDWEILSKARNAMNGAAFIALYDQGDTSAYNNDTSAADCALCEMLAFWTGPDAARIERLFNNSALAAREKWQNREDYREMTITKALDFAAAKGFYNPKYYDDKKPRPVFINEKRDSRGRVQGLVVSAPKLARFIREQEHYIFTQTDAKAGINRYWYSDGHYQMVSDDTIKGYIKQHIENYDYTLLKMKDVYEVFGQLTTDLVFHKDSELNANDALICFKNGILNWKTGELMPHTPDVFITRQIPVNWQPDAKDAPVFHKYMAYLCDGVDSLDDMTDLGRERYATLMEFLGATISNVPGHRFKKALFMYGDGDSGKSQLRKLAEYLVGPENSCAISLEQLEARFGTSQIYNKRLAGSADLPFMTVRALDVFKQTTGGDSLFAEYKGLSGFRFVYDGLLWFCMNRLPSFGGDQGRWVYERILPVHCEHVVPQEKRDPELINKMLQEAPAIVVEALHYFKKAAERGYLFTESADVAEIRESYRENNDNVAAWVSDRCIVIADALKNGDFDELVTIDDWEKSQNPPTVKQLYSDYQDWCRLYEGGYALKLKNFKTEIVNRFGETTKKRSGIVFSGIILKDEPLI